MTPHRAPHRQMRKWSALTLLLIIAACKQVPELDATVPKNLHKAPYPDLIPLDDTLFSGPLPQEESEEVEKSLAARRDRLQSRAAGLTPPVVDADTRKRMQDGIKQ